MHILSSNLYNFTEIVCVKSDRTSAFMQMNDNFMQYLFIFKNGCGAYALFFGVAFFCIWI